MKDITKRDAIAECPTDEPLEWVTFCLKRLWADRKHRLGDEVVDGMCFEELLGALISARAAIRAIEGAKAHHRQWTYESWNLHWDALVREVSKATNQNGEAVTAAVSSVKKTSERAKMTLRLRFAILKRDKFRCRICGKSPAFDDVTVLEVDHKQPISEGGVSERDNLWTLCRECNQGKGSSPIDDDEWPSEALPASLDGCLDDPCAMMRHHDEATKSSVEEV